MGDYPATWEVSKGGCCVVPTGDRLKCRPRPESDRHSELVERHGQPPVHRCLDRQLVVASA